MRSEFDLHPYQRRMIHHIIAHDKCALWVDMGLGKTVATLTAIQRLKRRFEARRVLVIAPLRVADMVWPDEVNEWDHLKLKVVRILGDAKTRAKAARTKADVHVINRENTEWLVDYHSVKNKVRTWPWDMVVLDESSSFKSGRSKRYKALARALPKIGRMVQLSGTPMPNGIEDLWSQLKLLDGGERLGHTVTSFRNRFMRYIPNSFKKVPAPGADKIVKKLTADICMTLQAKDYLSIKEPVVNPIRVRLNDTERDQYLKMERTFILELEGETITAANSGALWGKLLQLANGAVYTEHPEWVEHHRHKVDALLELHEGVDGPLMIAYTFLPDKERIAATLEQAGAKWRFMDTEKDKDDWNAGKFDRLILHPASAGHGLNLHKNGCRDVCWFGLTPNLEHYQQLNARIGGGHRAMFSDKPVTIHKILASGTQDTLVDGLLGVKDGWQNELMKRTRRLVEEYE